MASTGREWLSRSPAPPWALAALAVLLTVVALSHEDLPALALAGALLAPLTATALLATYPQVSLGVCVLASMATALAMTTTVPPWTAASGAALGVISFLAGRRMPRPATALAIFAAGVVLAVPLAVVAADAWTGLLMLALVVVLPWVLGRSMRQRAELVATAAERARLRERTRIAHDMHDTLGHELSLLALRAGVLELAPDLDERHRTAVAELRVDAGRATERLADIIGVLRDDRPAPLHPVSDRIEDLVDRAAEASTTVSLEWHGPRELPPVVDRAAYRVVQEALTNAMKHAPGAAVRVRLETGTATGTATRTATGETTVVTVSNPLLAGPRRAAGARVGLEALRERVRLAGGTFLAGPRDHMFEVVATLPHTEEQHAEPHTEEPGAP